MNCALASAAELLFRLTQITPVFWEADELERSPNADVGLRAGVVHDSETPCSCIAADRLGASSFLVREAFLFDRAFYT